MSLRNFAVSLTTITALICLSSCSELSTQSSRDKSSRSAVISKANWEKVLPRTMSDEFCDSESELLRCYPMSKDDCHQNVEQVTLDCLNHYSNEIPAKIGRADAITWGGNIGNCTKNGMLQVIDSKSLSPTNEACRQTIENM